ncbi:hypothetical protein GCM10010978_09990 [Compostibacillus humi]|uniref:HTH cro/C1-type domain-containing protein n=1 Tax=Compostibacillus humi TaxID=1245525 RepID=A0A8J3EJL4_9BACI|nr:helix-turn-helix transcriptional regulator [Compostibacillus humi]GGH72779.1 hypothetical protein GCM10010978_09990 [Compostibacillus humi]
MNKPNFDENRRIYDVKCNLKAILDARKGTENEISIRELATKSGLKFETVRRMYHDETRRYQRESLAAICIALDIDISDLLTLVPVKE